MSSVKSKLPWEDMAGSTDGRSPSTDCGNTGAFQQGRSWRSAPVARAAALRAPQRARAARQALQELTHPERGISVGRAAGYRENLAVGFGDLCH